MRTLGSSLLAAAALEERELVITRIFDAPRELVFKAWTEPERAVRWWGPQGFTTAHCEMDTRPGGTYRVCMRSSETVVTVTLAEYGAKTKLTLHQALFETVTARDLHQGGWASALECLAEYLAQG